MHTEFKDLWVHHLIWIFPLSYPLISEALNGKSCVILHSDHREVLRSQTKRWQTVHIMRLASPPACSLAPPTASAVHALLLWLTDLEESCWTFVLPVRCHICVFSKLNDDVRNTDERHGDYILKPSQRRGAPGRCFELPAGGWTRKPAGKVS